MKIGPLEIIILYRAYDSKDYWDGNWLNVELEAIAKGVSISFKGTFLRIDELIKWKELLQKIYKDLSGSVKLEAMEPNIEIGIASSGHGHFNVEVDITPDQLSQRHTFIFEIDQTQIGQLISEITKELDPYPLVGNRSNQ